MNRNVLALTARLTVALIAVGVAVAGHIDQRTGGKIERQFDRTFYVWLSIDLLAPIILAVGVRRLRTALACAAVLILLNTVPWVFWLLGSVEALEFVIFGHLFVVTTCLVGAIIDQRNAHKTHQTT